MMLNSAVAERPPATAKTGKQVKVMVVDDSVVIRGLVSRWLAEDKQLEVVAKCADGAIAVGSVAKTAPDVIILDIEMPVMDGMTALPKLLAGKPGVHVIIASTLSKRNAAISLKALALGASDYLPKPEGNSSITTSTDFRRELLAKVRALGGLDKATLPISSQRAGAGQSAARAATSAPAGQGSFTTAGTISLLPFQRNLPKVLAIGSSTGGPQALANVLGSMKGALAHIPCFITQHMPPTFTAMLAENLSRTSGFTCKEAEEGEMSVAGTIYIAPGGKHLLIKRAGVNAICRLDDGPQVNFTKPCVDVMFDSIIESYGANVLSVILTGMGSDGAKGAVRVREAGGNVIAQDEKSSVVWGMPGATAQSGVCSAVLPVDRIGAEITRICGGRAL